MFLREVIVTEVTAKEIYVIRLASVTVYVRRTTFSGTRDCTAHGLAEWTADERLKDGRVRHTYGVAYCAIDGTYNVNTT